MANKKLICSPSVRIGVIYTVVPRHTAFYLRCDLVNSLSSLNHHKFKNKEMLVKKKCSTQQISCQTKLKSITDTIILGADVTWHVGARHQCWTLKLAANCRGRQRGFLFLPKHIHAKPEGGHCPLRRLLCLWHLLLSRVTTLTFCTPDREFKTANSGGGTLGFGTENGFWH